MTQPTGVGKLFCIRLCGWCQVYNVKWNTFSALEIKVYIPLNVESRLLWRNGKKGAVPPGRQDGAENPVTMVEREGAAEEQGGKRSQSEAWLCQDGQRFSSVSREEVGHRTREVCSYRRPPGSCTGLKAAHTNHLCLCLSGLTGGTEPNQRMCIKREFIGLAYMVRLTRGSTTMAASHQKGKEPCCSVQEAECLSTPIWHCSPPAGFLESPWSSVHIGSPKRLMTTLKEAAAAARKMNSPVRVKFKRAQKQHIPSSVSFYFTKGAAHI